MSFWPCTIAECLNRSLFVNGDCRECGARLCRDHAGKEVFHSCEGMDMETRYREGRAQADAEMLDTILTNLDVPTIRRQAEAFRPGYTCHILPEDLDRGYLQAHGTNVNFPLTFDDGHKWMVRVRQPGRGRPPREAMRMTSMSEAATLRALNEGGVIVPQAWVTNLSDEPDALIYYFVDYLEGTPYAPFLQTRYTLPTDQTLVAILNVAKWFLTLERVHFNNVGSLHVDPDTPSEIIVGPVIAVLPQMGHPPFYRGPYKTAKDRYVDVFNTAMQHILAGHRSLPSEDIDDYLMALELRSIVMDCKELEEGPWYMKHGEDKGDHFMVREDGSISGVIDWECCKADAFMPPYSFNNGPYWDGLNALCPYELALMDAYSQLGRPDLAELVKSSKKFRRLNDFVRGDLATLTQLGCLQRAFKGEPDPQEGGIASEAELRASLMEKYKEDEGLRFVVARRQAEQ